MNIEFLSSVAVIAPDLRGGAATSGRTAAGSARQLMVRGYCGGWGSPGPNRRLDRYAGRTGSVAAVLRTTGSHPSMRPVTSTVTR
jgi:hypothetical protein